MTGNLLPLFNRIFRLLSARRRRQFSLLVVMMLIVGIFETITLGIVTLFATWLNSPAKVADSKWMRVAESWFPSLHLTPANSIYFIGAALVAAILAKNALITVVSYGNLLFGALADGFFGEELLRAFLRLPNEWHQNKNSADLIIAINWRFYLGSYFLGTFLQVLCDTFILGFLLATLFAVEPLITLGISLFFGLSGFILFSWVRRRIETKAAGRKRTEEEANRDVTKTIHGIKDVKIHLREAFFVGEYSERVRELAKYFGSLQFYQKLPTTALETLGITAVVAITCIMLYVLGSSVERVTGMLAMLVACAWRALPALNRILGNATQLKSSAPYVAGYLDYLDEANAFRPRENLDPIPEDDFDFLQTAEWSGVSFRYMKGQHDALSGIDLVLRKGEALGILGPSGAGKSTLVDVLIGLNAPTQGSILVDGKALDAEGRRKWRRMIGYVPQSPYIYDGTLAENVAFGIAPDRIDRERVLECCRMAAIDFLEDLEKGIDASIGERGAKLSGGQRQRIAIARALYHRPRILIFDEATSALDNRNEKAIQETIYAFKGKLTIILIAHRLTTVTECDRLICLKSGRITMEGPPDKVLPWYGESVAAEHKQPASAL